MLSELLSRFHDRRSFDCSDESVNRFLQEAAMQDQERDLSRTIVFADEDKPNRIIAFHTLIMSLVVQEEIPNDRPKIKRKLPVILLGQMGVDIKYQGQGFGDRLLIDVQERILGLTGTLAVRALALDARNERLAIWYEEHEFTRFPGSLRMFKSIAAIRGVVKNREVPQNDL